MKLIIVKYLVRTIINAFSLEVYESIKWQKGDAVGPITRSLINNTMDITGTPISILPLRLLIVKYVHQDWPLR